MLFRQFRQFQLLCADVRFLVQKAIEMSQALENLKAAVAAQTAIDQSAVTLITGIAHQIQAASDDPDIQALADALTAATAPLAAAVTANTPAAVAPAPVAVDPTPAATAPVAASIPGDAPPVVGQ